MPPREIRIRHNGEMFIIEARYRYPHRDSTWTTLAMTHTVYAAETIKKVAEEGRL